MQNIVLIPIGAMKQDVAGFLSMSLPEILHAQCHVHAEDVILEPFYSSDRRQYHSTPLKSCVSSCPLLPGKWIIFSASWMWISISLF